MTNDIPPFLSGIQGKLQENERNRNEKRSEKKTHSLTRIIHEIARAEHMKRTREH